MKATEQYFPVVLVYFILFFLKVFCKVIFLVFSVTFRRSEGVSTYH